MYASVSKRTKLKADEFEVRCYRSPDGTDRIDVHVAVGLYLAMTPREARVVRAELGRVLADLEPAADAEDVTGVIL